MKGRRREAAQREISSFFRRASDEKEVVAEAPETKEKTRRKKKQVDDEEEEEKEQQQEQDEEEEEEEEEEEQKEQEEEEQPVKRRQSRRKKEDEEEEEGNVVVRQQPRRKAKSGENDGQDSEDEEEERSVSSWILFRELGLHRMCALDLSLLKDDYSVDVEPRIGCPFFIRWGFDMLCFGGQNGSLGVADATTGRLCVAASGAHQRWTSEGLFLSPNCLASSSDDGTIRTWRLQDGGALEELGAYDAGVGIYSCDVTHCGRRVLAATKAGFVSSIDTESMRMISTRELHKGVVKCVRASDFENEILSCGNDKMLKLWDLRSNSDPSLLLEHNMVLNHVDSRGQRVLCCDRNGNVKIGDLRSPGMLLGSVNLEFKESVMCKPFWRDEKTFVACSPSGNILICSDRRILQKHDTEKKLQHICCDKTDPSKIFGVSKYEEILSWTL